MAGNDTDTGEIQAYLSRLTGETVSPGEPLRLRSVQRAAFASWARQQKLAIRLEVIGSGTPFLIRDLLGTGEVLPAESSLALSAQTPALSLPVLAAATPGALGIDIEEIDGLPYAEDYREHPFYQDNFTPAEIAYCVLQADVRASFCGTWAAKEAILKTGVVSAPTGHLKGIEIARDGVGRPLFPGCSLSISHTARTAVAVCSAMLG